jgi:hypothetical protein
MATPAQRDAAFSAAKTVLPALAKKMIAQFVPGFEQGIIESKAENFLASHPEVVREVSDEWTDAYEAKRPA